MIDHLSVEPLQGSDASNLQPKVAPASQADLGLGMYNAFGVKSGHGLA
jgi:hypothetical protein